MTIYQDRESWDAYCAAELITTRALVSRLGFDLEASQIHIGGERSVISGKKLVLIGRRQSDGKRVVIKSSSHPEGRRELEHERACRTTLDTIRFAYNVFLSPEQIDWRDEQGCLLSITAYIEQDCSFLERTLEEQFFIGMKAFETQEGAHATTYEHVRMVRGVFGMYRASTYLKTCIGFREEIRSFLGRHNTVDDLLGRAQEYLQTHEHRIEQYCGFLTHTDFVPHNIRTVGRDIYLLDHSSIRFGNKYDGWARFLNFMLLHHRNLEKAVLMYVQKNRTSTEYESLSLMRVYRLVEIICYYAKRSVMTQGSLHELDTARVSFWTDVLRSILDEQPLSEDRIQAYRALRDALRSEDEKQRQQGLH